MQRFIGCVTGGRSPNRKCFSIEFRMAGCTETERRTANSGLCLWFCSGVGSGGSILSSESLALPRCRAGILIYNCTYNFVKGSVLRFNRTSQRPKTIWWTLTPSVLNWFSGTFNTNWVPALWITQFRISCALLIPILLPQAYKLHNHIHIQVDIRNCIIIYFA